MLVYVLCEFSGEVRDAFARRGHDAWSCDLLPSERGGQHFQTDCHNLEYVGVDLVVAHPPCQYLSKMGAAHWKRPGWSERQAEALSFVLWIMSLPVPRLAIENPVGKVNTAIRKPDQRIQPYQFGHPYTKETCLWLRGLPLLRPTVMVEPVANWVRPGNVRNRRFNRVLEGGNGNAKDRSRTFRGIAEAMAEQWGG